MIRIIVEYNKRRKIHLKTVNILNIEPNNLSKGNKAIQNCKS